MNKSSQQSAKTGNRLAETSSPYLLQHASNPVDWYPWGADALQRAKEEDKPIFLSIGYSACHWCHVMEHQSFENQAIADYLNEHFISIKVDREERPDLDDLYMTAVQMLSGSGGWPMTLFLTPELKPFFGGTYFPPESQLGQIGFKTLLERIRQVWVDQRHDVKHSADEITAALARHAEMNVPADEALTSTLLDRAVEELSSTVDAQWGGFGDAPKFPPVSSLFLLMRRYQQTGAEPLPMMIRGTLDAMGAGGFFDQVGGGFHRYTVDAQWLTPHFEKMLYDNAQLASLYTAAWQWTDEPAYRRVARETLDYVQRDMTAPEGGFYSSEDADSEGGEGRFYIWSKEELERVLGPDDAPAAIDYWGVTAAGNFEGMNILHRPSTDRAFAEQQGLTSEELADRIADWKRKLLRARSTRPRPARDDKVIAAWNGLMISAFAGAAQAFDDAGYVATARHAAHFVIHEMTVQGGVHRTWRAGRRSGPGYLDDHACMIQAMVDLYETDFDRAWLDVARTLFEMMEQHFADKPDAAYFYTSATHHDDVIVRARPLMDGSEPSGNSVAAHALLRLGALLDHDGMRRRAAAILIGGAGQMERVPRSVLALLGALDEHLGPGREIVLAGDPQSEAGKALLKPVRETYLPRRVIACAEPDRDHAADPLRAGKTPVNGGPSVYICENYACKAPVTTPKSVAAHLNPPDTSDSNYGHVRACERVSGGCSRRL